MSISHVFKYEWLSFIRNRFQLLIILLTIIFGLYSIYYGYAEITKQKITISTVNKLHQLERERIQKGFLADTTTATGKKEYQLSTVPRMLWARQIYAVTFEPSTLAPLSIGQRDLQPYYYKLTTMSLYYQIFQNEIANPQKLLVGNFDLSFVFIYLFPLLIIAFCYGLLSSEKDRGVLSLLKSQTAPVYKVIGYKLLFYFLIILSLAVFLSITGFAVSGASLISDFSDMIFWLAAVTTYCIFWFCVLFLIISLNKNSSFNAIAGIGSWLVFLIIIPAILNIIITLSMPLNTSILTGISRRTGVADEENFENQKRVIVEYLKQHPELDYGEQMYKSNLIAKGFAAYTELNDQKSAKLVQTYQQQVGKREEIARRFDFLNPAVNAQTMFNAITASDLASFRNFYQSIKNFHGGLVTFYYPKLFGDKNLTQHDYLSIPRFKVIEPEDISGNLLSSLGWLLIVSGCMYFVAYRGIKKNI